MPPSQIATAWGIMMIIKKKAFWVCADILIIAGCLVFLYPIMIGFINSFKSLANVLIHPLSIKPDMLTFDAYITAFKAMKYSTRFVNSAFITCMSLVVVVLFSSMAAYKLSRDTSRFSNGIFSIILMFILIPFQCTMIPLTVMMTNLNLVNTYTGIIFGYIGFLCPISMFLYHGYIKSVPYVLDESARLDGCSNVSIFFRIIFPLIKPMTATIVIIHALSIWNDFLFPMLMLQSENKKTLVIGLITFSSTYMKQWDKLLAATVMVVLPVLSVYIAMQKHIIKGLVSGAVKS